MRFDEQEFASEMSEMSTIFEQLANNLKHLFMRHPNIHVETGKHGVLVSNAYDSYLISSSNIMLDYINTGSEFLNVMLVPVINTVQEGFIAGKSTQLFNMFKANRLTKDDITKETYTNLLLDPLNRTPY